MNQLKRTLYAIERDLSRMNTESQQYENLHDIEFVEAFRARVAPIFRNLCHWSRDVVLACDGIGNKRSTYPEVVSLLDKIERGSLSASGEMGAKELHNARTYALRRRLKIVVSQVSQAKAHKLK